MSEITEDQIKDWFREQLTKAQAIVGGKYVSVSLHGSKMPSGNVSFDWNIYASLIATACSPNLEPAMVDFASKLETPVSLREQAAKLLIEAEEMEQGSQYE